MLSLLRCILAYHVKFATWSTAICSTSTLRERHFMMLVRGACDSIMIFSVIPAPPMLFRYTVYCWTWLRISTGATAIRSLNYETSPLFRILFPRPTSVSRWPKRLGCPSITLLTLLVSCSAEQSPFDLS